MSVITRIQRATAATISVTLYSDATPENPLPDSATLEVLRGDGTVLVAAGTQADDSGTGVFEYTFAPTDIPDVDELTVRWTSTRDGYEEVYETVVQVTGGPLFALPDITEEVMGKTVVDYALARIAAEDLLEHACGVAFTTRYRRDTLSGDGTRELLLPTPKVQKVRAVTIDDVALTVDELAELKVRGPEGIVYRPAAWPSGEQNITIAWEHGYPRPYVLAARPALMLAERMLLDDVGGVSPRATSVSDGTTTQLLVTAGVRGMVTDIPEVNAFIDQHQFTGGFA